ncbi:hypothetical protein ACKKBF_B04560 [Auxenochlorella protothecoides x Auxenochlorella symbiontica]
MDGDDHLQLIATLEEIKACWRCVLRHSGCRTADAYTGSLEDVLGEGSPDLPSATMTLLQTHALKTGMGAPSPGPVCPLCLGSLQEEPHADGEASLPSASLQPAVQAVVDKYEVPVGQGFSLDVSLPAAAAVRARAMAVRHPGACAGACVDLKEALRLRFTPPLEAVLGTSCAPGAGLRLTLALSAPGVAGEGAWLAQGIQQQVDQSRRRRHTGKRRHGKQDIVPADAMVASARLVDQLAALTPAAFLSACPASAASLAPPPAPATLGLRACRAPFHLGGRYTKLGRDIPQSPWFIDGERRGGVSLEERLAAVVLPGLRCSDASFLSSGREDMDVRMLGTGRPWALELRDAGRAPPDHGACLDLERGINEAEAGRVGVRGLRVLTPAEVAAIKAEDGDREKSYVALCWAPRPVGEQEVAQLEARQGLVIKQQTPMRVLHRRANLVRPRTVVCMRVRSVPSSSCFLLGLRTQSGTYVKEFVHGDLGRTVPCLGDLLGMPVTILQLDVMDIHMDF